MQIDYLEQSLKTIRLVSQALLLVSTAVFVSAMTDDKNHVIKQADAEITALLELNFEGLDSYVYEKAKATEARFALAGLAEQAKTFGVSPSLYVANLYYKGAAIDPVNNDIDTIIQFFDMGRESGGQFTYAGFRWTGDAIQTIAAQVSNSSITGATLNSIETSVAGNPRTVDRNSDFSVFGTFNFALTTSTEIHPIRMTLPGYFVLLTDATVIDWLEKDYRNRYYTIVKEVDGRLESFSALKTISTWDPDFKGKTPASARNFLNSEKLLSKTENLSVLGLSIDKGLLVWLTPIILFALSLYLYLHLKHLDSEWADKQGIKGFPWMGFFTNWPSRFLTVVSLGAFPVATVGILLFWRFPGSMNTYFSIGILFGVSAMSLLLLKMIFRIQRSFA